MITLVSSIFACSFLSLRKAFGKEIPSGKLNFFSLLEPNPETDISTDPIESAEERKGDLLMIQKIREEDV